MVGVEVMKDAIVLSMWAKVRSRDLRWWKMEWLQDKLWEKPKVLIYPMAPEYDLS